MVDTSGTETPLGDLETPTLTHVDERGRARMVDVSPKPATMRTAVAAGRVVLGEEAFNLVKENRIQKGDVLTAYTGGGAGYGEPAERSEAARAHDIHEGFVGPDAAILTDQAAE